MAGCTVEGLWNQVRGIPPYISEQEFQIENINLLCQLLGGGGGGGGLVGIWTYWEETGPTPSGPPPNQAIAATVRFRDGNPPMVWDPVDLVWR